MLPGRFAGTQQSTARKSRLEGKHSMLPKPVRPGSIDRLSSDRRPSTAAARSSSAEPPRITFGGRLSKDASAHKLPINRRSRSQQGDRAVSMTPLHSNRPRQTTTPVRTPSEDRGRGWQTCLERVQAFVTIKDQRPISNVAWQRAQMARVQEALSGRGGGGGGGGASMVLVRPLTIARFVDITGALLNDVIHDAKLNTDNYVTKLPHLAKRLLYPGTLSKSWLKTVNTLHAFPHALALIAYLLDIVQHLESPISDEWLYVENDELACLRREYVHQCWIRFQEPVHQFDDLNAEYLQRLRHILAYDEERVQQLRQSIKQYSASLEDEAEQAGMRAELAGRAERRDALVGAIRAERRCTRDVRARIQLEHAAAHDHDDLARTLSHDIDRLRMENDELEVELQQQEMSVEQRCRLLEQVDYARKVQDSKQELIDQILEISQSKETELAQWQKKTLDCCVEYNKRIIHLNAQFPHLAEFTVDQQELMSPHCAETVRNALDALRALATQQAEARAQQHRARAQLATKRDLELEELRTKVRELQQLVGQEQQALEEARAAEASSGAAWAAQQRQLDLALQAFRRDADALHDAQRLHDHLQQDVLEWHEKLSEMQEYIEQQKKEIPRIIEREKEKRTKLIATSVAKWNDRIAAL